MSAERGAYKSASEVWSDLSAKDRVTRLLAELAAKDATIQRLGAEVNLWKTRCELLSTTRAVIRWW